MKRLLSFASLAPILTILGCTPPATTSAVAPAPVKCPTAVVQWSKSPDAAAILVRIENDLPSWAQIDGICIVVDGENVTAEPPAPFVTAFAGHRPLELRARLDKSSLHLFEIRASFAARAPYEGQRFVITSTHRLEQSNVRAGVMNVVVREDDDPAADAPHRIKMLWGPLTALTLVK